MPQSVDRNREKQRPKVQAAAVFLASLQPSCAVMLVRMVPSTADDARGQLLQAVLDGNLRKASAALQAGAELDGSPGLRYHGLSSLHK